MVRFALRFLGIWLFAAAIVMAVVDGAKSLAASSVVTTPVGEAWAALAGGEAVDPTAYPWPLDRAVGWFLAAPALAVLAFVGIGLLILGRRKRSVRHQFAT
jgi:hypothetical protein